MKKMKKNQGEMKKMKKNQLEKRKNQLKTTN